MHRLLWLGVVACFLSPLAAWSQEPSEIVVDSRIRITEIDAGRSEHRSGTVVAAGADSIVLSLDTGGEPATFPWAGISRIEVSKGKKGHIPAGVGIGFLAGAGLGALFGAAYAPDGGSDGSTEGVSALMGAGVGAGIGMLLGAGIGAMVKTESWKEVPSSRWHVYVWPIDPDNFALALSVRF